MMQTKSTLFISDLHLDEIYPGATQGFLKFLTNCDKSIDAIYILGDLFEAWIGDDNQTDYNKQIIHALNTVVSKGIPIYVMHGNRDFLLGKKFLKQTGCKLLPDEAKITLYNTPILLMHGDTLCTRDIKYQKTRKKSHNFLIKFLFLRLPLKKRRAFVNKWREQSKAYTQNAARDIMDVTPEEVDSVMQKHGVNYLIHGHTHRPAFHEGENEKKSQLRIVLGAWHHRGNMLKWDETGKKEWIEFDF